MGVPLTFNRTQLAFHVVSGESDSVLVGVSSSAAVTMWGVVVRDGLQWLSVRKVSADIVSVTVQTRTLCAPDGRYSPMAVEGVMIGTANVSGLTSQYTIALPVTLTVSSPVMSVTPLSVVQVFAGTRGTAELPFTISLSNTGDLPLVVNTSVTVLGRSTQLAWRVSPSVLVVPPGSSAPLLLSVAPNSAPPDEYSATVVLDTDQPSCSSAAGRVVDTVTWRVRVADMLLFPGSVHVELSPDEDPPVVELYLANFAGESLDCSAVFAGGDCERFLVGFDAAVGVVNAAELLVISVGTHYPSLSEASTRFLCEVQVGCTRMGDHKLLPSQSVLLRATPLTGAPCAPTSAVDFASVPESVHPNDVISIVVTARDRVGSLVTAIDAVINAVAVHLSSSPLATVHEVQTADGAVQLAVRIPRDASGSHVLQVLMFGSAPPDSSFAVTVTAVTCPLGMTLDPSSAMCVCRPGWHLNATLSLCEGCPPGTFQPRQANVSAQQCIACTAGWYCLSGSRGPSAVCPGEGFDCSMGRLMLLKGYWFPDGRDLVVNASGTGMNGSGEGLALTTMPRLCLFVDACPNSDGSCGIGYTGARCAVCARDYVPIENRCIRRLAPGGSGMLMVIWLVVVVSSTATLVTLVHEERGVQRQRQVWVSMHGVLLATELGMLCDSLQIMTLQLLIPSQLSSVFFESALWLCGAALGPGTWPGTIGLFQSTTTGLWFPLYTLPALAAFAVGLSLLLAPLVWKRMAQRPMQLLRRFRTAVRHLLWTFFPAVVWAVAGTRSNLWAIVSLG